MDELISRQDAIDAMNEVYCHIEKIKKRPVNKTEQAMYLDMIGAVKSVPSAQRDTDEWCTDCKEYDHKRHCCPRWNRVILETLKDAQPDIAEDGTLTVTVRQGAEVGRVLVQEAGTTNGALFYRDAQPEIIRCKDCKNSEHWYRDRRRCFLWSEDGVSVFDDGFCNYAERRTDE